MRKTLQEVADYLKAILVPDTRETYAVNPLYTDSAGEAKLRQAVAGFREFLVRLYETLSATASIYDTSKKAAHAYENRTTLSVYYPFLHNVGTLLKNIGYHGHMPAGTRQLLCDNKVIDKKLSAARSLECLRFLADCGLRFDGLDLQAKKPDLTGIKTLTVEYPDNPAMLGGLKALAIAEKDHGTLVNQDVFLRCDYRTLKKEQTGLSAVVRDTISPLPAAIQDFVLMLHQRSLDMGLVGSVEIKGFHIYIKHSYRRKDVWGINASLNNGYHINLKPTRTSEYLDAVGAFPVVLRELIAAGYGCGRKRAAGRCDGGCRGIPVALDNSVLELSHGLETWLDLELACLKK